MKKGKIDNPDELIKKFEDPLEAMEAIRIEAIESKDKPILIGEGYAEIREFIKWLYEHNFFLGMNK